MSVYNAEKYLRDSIASILKQSFTDFEFIIINDGSTDNSKKIIYEFKRLDKRIVSYEKVNTGLADSLNLGIAKSKGRFIARMDADDISHIDRLKIQLEFIKKNKLDICGAGIQKFGYVKNKQLYFQKADDIKLFLFFNTCFAHPTILGKKEVFVRFKYRKKIYRGQDYDLWTRMALKGIKMSNVPLVLLNYRVINESKIKKELEILEYNKLKIQKNYHLKYFGHTNYYKTFNKFSNYKNQSNTKDFARLIDIFLGLDQFDSDSRFRILSRLSYYTKPASIENYFNLRVAEKKLQNKFSIDIKLLIVSLFRLDSDSWTYRELKNLFHQ